MKTFYAKNSNKWRIWLKKNHDKEKEILLLFYKKHTGKPSITYKEALEEALCFGWIDGIKRRVDDEKYTHRYTPRKEKSKWSPYNIQLAEQLIKDKRMSKAGLNAFDRKLFYAKEIIKVKTTKKLIIPPEILKAFKKEKTVWKNFNALAPSYQKQHVWWIAAAKRTETKERRLKEVLSHLKQNKMLGMR